MPATSSITPVLVYSDIESAHTFLVEDVDAHYERVRAAGAVIEHTPQDQPYGRREYGVRDPEGHRWWFGTALE
ncbi:VOC family protein [Arthrobacter sp. H35-D1]|uniref:VOC family protein n=1 Tax=Arthrobacter sp. H35-D1 TaxID=3046202 RepID=UPI0024BB6837|nr:VOC family protein [Arthrobacter sp. H35-D1]MDJ0311816.1 VOC family protein [Arthrobacter sp. H35-D1]